MAALPGGGTAQINLDKDKNRKSIKIARSTKALRDAVQGKLGPDQKAFARRDEGWVSVDFLPLVRVVATGPKEQHLSWNHAHPSASRVREAEVEADFVERCRHPNDRIHWS